MQGDCALESRSMLGVRELRARPSNVTFTHDQTATSVGMCEPGAKFVLFARQSIAHIAMSAPGSEHYRTPGHG